MLLACGGGGRQMPGREQELGLSPPDLLKDGTVSYKGAKAPPKDFILKEQSLAA